MPRYWTLYYYHNRESVYYSKSYSSFRCAEKHINALSRNQNIEPFLYDALTKQLYGKSLILSETVEIKDIETFIKDLMNKDAERERLQTL